MMRRVVLRFAPVAVVAVLLSALDAGVAGAAGRTFYATPTPLAGADCSSGNPCSLDLAVASTNPSVGDVVVMAPGHYVVAATGSGQVGLSLVNDGVTLEGQNPADKPVIVTSAQSAVLIGGQDVILRDVEIDGSLDVRSRSTIERVIAEGATAIDACHIQSSGVTLLDTVCATTTSGADGVYAEGRGIVMRNVTATGPRCGVEGSGRTFTGTDNNDFTMINTIARAILSSSVADVCITNPGHGITGYADHSTYGSVSEPGDEPLFTSDNDVPPLFGVSPVVNPSGTPLDLHETFGSPTIGAGVTSPANGALDVDGQPRTSCVNGVDVTDVGADQVAVAAPCAPPPPPTTTTTTTGTTTPTTGTTTPTTTGTTTPTTTGTTTPTTGTTTPTTTGTTTPTTTTTGTTTPTTTGTTTPTTATTTPTTTGTTTPTTTGTTTPATTGTTTPTTGTTTPPGSTTQPGSTNPPGTTPPNDPTTTTSNGTTTIYVPGGTTTIYVPGGGTTTTIFDNTTTIVGGGTTTTIGPDGKTTVTGPGGTTTTPPLAPALSNVVLVPTKFALPLKKGKKKRKRVHYGAKVSFTLNTAAQVQATVLKPTTGRSVKTKGQGSKVTNACVKQTRKNKKGHKKCTLWAPVGGAFTVNVTAAGRLSVNWSGKVSVTKAGKQARKKPTLKALARGTYRLSLVATDASKRKSPTVIRTFRIVKG